MLDGMPAEHFAMGCMIEGRTISSHGSEARSMHHLQMLGSDIEKLIHIDTDTLYLEDPVLLWMEFDKLAYVSCGFSLPLLLQLYFA